MSMISYRRNTVPLFRVSLIGCRNIHTDDGFTGYLNKKLKDVILKCYRKFCTSELPKERLDPRSVTLFGGAVRRGIVESNAWNVLPVEERLKLSTAERNILESKDPIGEDRKELRVDADLVCTGKGDVDIFFESPHTRRLFIEYMQENFDVREKTEAYCERVKRYSGLDVIPLSVGIKHNFLPLHYRNRIKIDCVVRPSDRSASSRSFVPPESTVSTIAVRGDGVIVLFPSDGTNNDIYYGDIDILPSLLGRNHEGSQQTSMREKQCVNLILQELKNKYGRPTLVSPRRYMTSRNPQLVGLENDDEDNIYIMSPSALHLYEEYLYKMLQRIHKLAFDGFTFRTLTPTHTSSDGLTLRCTALNDVEHAELHSKISNLVFVQGSTTIYAQCSVCKSEYPFTTFCDIEPVFSQQEMRTGIVEG